MPLILGTETASCGNLRNNLLIAEKIKQDFIVTPLFHPRFRRDNLGVSDERDGPQTRSDRLLQVQWP